MDDEYEMNEFEQGDQSDGDDGDRVEEFLRQQDAVAMAKRAGVVEARGSWQVWPLFFLSPKARPPEPATPSHRLGYPSGVVVCSCLGARACSFSRVCAQNRYTSAYA